MNKRGMELLAPAGDMNALKAAVQNGADAVYLGAGAFNARRGAANFEGNALNEAVAYCHAHGVKVHVTLNTLVRQDELPALEDAMGAVYMSGADAVIVQDFGVARALWQAAPGIQLHASTQMAVHNARGVRFLAEQGFDRVVLARELTWREMAECAKCGVEIETFIHGALCVACSGQCLMSSLVGGRSGNRGMCAQPCRLPWRLDGHAGYLLSTKDLCALDDLAALRDAGVTSLKIEGRLKRAEYVAETVAAYRRALDALYAGAENPSAAEDRAAMKQMFNRGGFTRGYGPGVSDVELMFPDRPNHLGVPVGRCRADGEALLSEAVEAADALVLRGRNGDDAPVRLSGRAGERVKCPGARKGDMLIRLVSEAQMRHARDSFDGEHRPVPVSLRAFLRVGQPARLWASDGAFEAEAVGDVVQAATGRALDRERVEAQLRKTGGTAYTVKGIAIDADDGAFCPASLCNALRRDALAALDARRTEVSRRARPVTMPDLPKERPGKPLLAVQSASVDILKAALECGADQAVLAPEDLRPEALEKIDLAALRGHRLALALPAVMSGEALDGLNAWAAAHADMLEETYLSNIGQLGMGWPGRLTGDFMLNIGNDLSVAQLNEWGLEAYTPSVELNTAQIERMDGRKSLVMWGRLPLMHLRHCPLRAAEGMKGLHRDCRHCDACGAGERLNGKALVDRKSAAFPLRRLAMPGGCVVQVLNSAALMPLRKLNRLPAAESWRLLLREDEPAEAIVRVYRAALDGEDFRELPQWREIEAMQTTTGHYFRGVE